MFITSEHFKYLNKKLDDIAMKAEDILIARNRIKTGLSYILDDLKKSGITVWNLNNTENEDI